MPLEKATISINFFVVVVDSSNKRRKAEIYIIRAKEEGTRRV